jgi:dienelactone hydrolase
LSERIGAGMFRFGPEQCLVGAITDPKTSRSSVGAIIWGMGPGELRIARSLARLGMAAMLVQQKERAFTRLDTEGVRYCKAAIESLHAQRGVDSFILMGICGRASISFYTAVDDPRVVGLILANPALSPVLTVLESYKHKLLSAASWRRLIAGKIDLSHHFKSAKRVKSLLFGRLMRADEKTLIASSKAAVNRDLMMPDNIGPRLEALAARGVRVLLVFSDKDPGLGYFRKRYGKYFERLSRQPGMSVEVITTAAHRLTLDDSASSGLEDTMRRWAESARFLARQMSSPDDLPQPPAVTSSDHIADQANELA